MTNYWRNDTHSNIHFPISYKPIRWIKHVCPLTISKLK